MLNHKNARKLLEAYDWKKTLGGKHSTKMEKEGERPITLPMHNGDDYGPDLRASILREAKIEGHGTGQQDTGTSGSEG